MLHKMSLLSLSLCLIIVLSGCMGVKTNKNKDRQTDQIINNLTREIENLNTELENIKLEKEEEKIQNLSQQLQIKLKKEFSNLVEK